MGAKKKHQKGQRQRSHVIRLCFFLLIVFVFTFGERWLTVVRVCGDIRNAEEQLANIKEERIKLEEEISLLRNKDYLSAMARENLGYIYPGEEVWLESEVDDGVLPKSADDEIIAD